MSLMWDPNAKKWVNKPAGTAGVVDPRFRTAKVSAPVTVPKYSAVTKAEEDYAKLFGDTSGYDFDALYGTAGASGGGGVTGPTREQQRQYGMAAARPLQQAGQQAANMYRDFATQQAGSMQGFYEPYFKQAETSAEDQRRAALDFLAQQYAGNEANINAATQAALQGIPESQAYSNVPLVELQQQANPLLGSLQAFGADTGAAQGQSAQDAQLAQQLAQMVRGSAGQLNQAQQGMRTAAMGDINAAQARALQGLTLGKAAETAGIGGRYQTSMGDIAAQRAQSGAGIEEARQQLLSKGLESLVGGTMDAATQRAKTIAEFGTKKAKAKAKPKVKGANK